MTLFQARDNKHANPSHTDNNPDTFTAAWGASTHWKTGITHRSGTDPYNSVTRSGTQPTHAGYTIAGTAAPLPNSLQLHLNKPLPPLPQDGSNTSDPSQHNVRMFPNQSLQPIDGENLDHVEVAEESPQFPSKSSESSVPITARKKTIFGFVRTGSKKHRSELVSKPLNDPINRKTLIPGAPRDMPMPPMTQRLADSSKPAMVDRGTQTSPSLEKQYQKWLQQQRTGTNTTPLSRGAGQPLREMPMVPTPTAALRTPLWSPRTFFKITSGPYDYFALPSEKIEDTAGESPAGSNDASTQTARYFTLHSPPSPRRRSETDAVHGSIGSYESRYPDRPYAPQEETLRPPLARKESSSSTIVHSVNAFNAKKQKSREELSKSVAPQAEVIAPRASSDPPKPMESTLQFAQTLGKPGKQSRPLPSPFQKKTHHNRRSTTSRSESSPSPSPMSSPLRQEIQHESPTGSEASREKKRQASHGFFRLPIYGSDAVSITPPETDVPDHFIGSPLCPMSPLHKSKGLGTCPYHGRRKSTPEDSDGAFDVVPPSRKASLGSGADDEFWKEMAASGFGGRPHRKSTHFNMSVQDHEEGSIDCPAHPRYRGAGTRGICVFHGRTRHMVDSDDSIPRVHIV